MVNFRDVMKFLDMMELKLCKINAQEGKRLSELMVKYFGYSAKAFAKQEAVMEESERYFRSNDFSDISEEEQKLIFERVKKFNESKFGRSVDSNKKGYTV